MTSTLAPPAAADAEAEVLRVRVLQREGRHAEALAAALDLARGLPDNRDVRLAEAVSLRHLGRIAEALTALDKLEQLRPRFSRLYEERGMCRVALRDAPGAIAALLQAVNINPALPASWSMLQGLYRMTGEAEQAATAAEHVAVLKALPAEVVTATSLVSDGEIASAEAMVRAYLLRCGDNPEAMRLLARIGVAREVLDDAEALLAATLELAPDHRAARHEYAQVLVSRHKHLQARTQIERLLAIDPANLDYRALAATVAVGLGEHAHAIDLLHALLAEVPDSPDLQLWLGHALKTVGRLDEAVAAYRGAAASRPDFGDAYWSLANLKIYRFDDAELDRMRVAEAAASTSPEDRWHLAFGLGKALEDRGAVDESWGFYARGNALKHAVGNYQPELVEANTRAQTQVCTQDFMQRRRGWGASAADPIFIVGLPRSGSTLLEQILASHSQVEGTQELPFVQAIVGELQGRRPDPDARRYPAVLADLTAEDLVRLGERYLSQAGAYRSDRPRFIDKMPNNFRHLGLIRLMLPNARIIDARREPMACCFGNLKQLFAQGQEFSYGVEDIARYYRTYVELMAHWDEALPGAVLRVQLEAVIDDLQGQVRRLLDFCSLPFEPACVEFHRSQRSVRTPSSEQVRRPIFREGLDQWRRYAPWLDPLRIALGDVVEAEVTASLWPGSA